MSTPPSARKREPPAPDAEPTARSEGKLDTPPPRDAGAKEDALAPDAAVEVFIP